MYKTASRSTATQRAVARHQDDSGAAPWLVVALRVGRDNQGRERVYRRIFGDRTRNKAHEHSAELTATHGFVAVICGASGAVFSFRGDVWLVLRWHRSRRQANRGACWRTSSTYGYRAMWRRDPGASEEARRYTHDEIEDRIERLSRRIP